MSTVNPTSQEIRVEILEKTNEQEPLKPIGGTTGAQEEHGITNGSTVESAGKKKSNGTVNPKGTVQVFLVLVGFRWRFWRRKTLAMLMLVS